MSTVTIAVDIAKHVFELAIAGPTGIIRHRKRLSRAELERFWRKRAPCRVIMEACASSHHWGRYLTHRGFDVALLPAHYVKPYRRRNKTDRADCEALLEADRCAGLQPVAVKSPEQQAIIALHRVRSRWLATRTARINAMRALLYEFGIFGPSRARNFMNEVHDIVRHNRAALPGRVQSVLLMIWAEVRALEQRISAVEDDLAAFAREQPVIQALLRVAGLGLVSATALFATIGDIRTFGSGRQLACWLGLTPREWSSGATRRLGRISKKGDRYLRVLLIQGARAALSAARRLHAAGKPLTHLQQWALHRARHAHTSHASVALANKIARIAWAVWYHGRDFDGNHVARVQVT